MDSTPWPEGSIYISCLLTSRRPPYIKFWQYFYINAAINTLLTFPITLYYLLKGKYVIHPAWHQAWLEEAVGNRDGDQEELIEAWLSVIEQDVSLVIMGWRSRKSSGAMREADLAKKLKISVRTWWGRLLS